MIKFLEGFVEFRATSEIEAYDKTVSKWLEEAKEGGFADQLLDEMIFYAKKAEAKKAQDAVKREAEKKSEHADGSRTAFLR